jgi:putative ABC transport system permease protein
MGDQFIDLSLVNLSFTLALVVALIGLSTHQRFGLERTAVWASIRCVVQLLAVGYLLKYVFAIDRWWLVVVVVGVMAAIAGHTGAARIELPFPRKGLILTGSVVLSTGITLVVGLGLVIRPETWWEPQYLIPLAGIFLGNAMNSAALGAERLSASFRTSRLEVETLLALGMPPAQACHRLRREAFRAALLPTLNTMFVVGIVQLPGVMTGQIMSGVDPYLAAKYQIFIMFTWAFATTTAAFLTGEAVWRRHFNLAWQLTEPSSSAS